MSVKMKDKAVNGCRECSATFDSPWELADHVRHAHLTFACAFCGLRFHSQTEVDYHERLHQPEKVNPDGTISSTVQQSLDTCPFCGKTIRLESDLKAHIEVCPANPRPKRAR
jgi:hypothetical protein